MRILVLCELFPLAQGTRALQMAKVAAALEQHAAHSGSGDDVFVVSGVDGDRKAEARAWLDGAPQRSCLPYFPARDSASSVAWAAHGLHLARAMLTRNTSFVHRARDHARAIIETYAPDVLMTVSTPLLWHRVGIALKKDFPALRWASFFADPRPLGLLPPPFRRRKPTNCYKAWLCRRVLADADAVIAPNRYMLQWMEQSLGVGLAGRQYVIPHCGLKAAPEPDASPYRGWLLHVGSLLQSQMTPDLLRAIKATAQRHPHDFRGLFCVGRVADRLRSLARSLHMEPFVKTLDRVPPQEAASIVASADANLVSDTPLDVGYFLHSKFADYAVNGRPILVVGPPRCPMRDYLEAYGGGLAVVHDQKEIERALEILFVRKDFEVAQASAANMGGRATLARHFSPDTVAAKYVQAFQHMRGLRAAA